jgi:hypothetical protein
MHPSVMCHASDVAVGQLKLALRMAGMARRVAIFGSRVIPMRIDSLQQGAHCEINL